MEKLIINKRLWDLFSKVWGEEFVKKHHILDKKVPKSDLANQKKGNE